MKIIGFSLEKISAHRENTKTEGIKIKSNIDIKNIEKEKLEGISKETIKIAFEFSVKYEPKLAEISFLGFVLMNLEESKAKELLKTWKSKKVPDEIRIPLFNFILTKCNIRSFQLEEELNLPFHIPLPRLAKEQSNNANYVH